MRTLIAVAGLSIAATAPTTARADVVYQRVDAEIFATGIDLNQDGFADITLYRDGPNRVIVVTQAQLTVCRYEGEGQGRYTVVDNLAPGTMIGPGSLYEAYTCFGTCGYPIIRDTAAQRGDWLATNVDGLIGFRVFTPSGVKYGWMRVLSPDQPDGNSRFVEWAYESTSATPIAAGDVGPCMPVIGRPPEDARVLPGDFVRFSAFVPGSSFPLTYQWRRNGQPLTNDGRISGAQSTLLIITNAEPGDAGVYTLDVSNRCGQVTSEGATLTYVRECPPFAGTALDVPWGSAAVPDSPQLDFTTRMTAECWFRVSLGGYKELISKGDAWAATTNRSFALQHSGDKAGFTFFLGEGPAQQQFTLSGAATLGMGEWHHAAATLDLAAGVCKLYVNGVLDAEMPVNAGGLSLCNSTEPVRLGGNQSLQGRLDDVRLWNIVRTPEEIATAYHRHVDPDSPGLVAYYMFEEGSGTIAYDQTGNGHHATLAASLGWFATTPCCAVDFNGDGFLDFFDYDDFVNCFEGSGCPAGTTADFNADGFQDFFDYDDYVIQYQIGC